MKLYTEEQVIEMIEKRRKTGLTAEYLVLSTPPIQLPSDEEIFKKSIEIMEDWYGSGCKEEIDAHFRGAKWLRDKIQNDNK